MTTILCPYIIYNQSYNKMTNTITEYYGVAKIYTGTYKKKELMNIIIKNNKNDYEEARINKFINCYENYYFDKSSKSNYNTIINKINEKIEDAKKRLSKREYEVEKNNLMSSMLKYKMITNDKQQFLKDIVRKHKGNIKLKWLDKLECDEDNLIDEVYKYIEAEENKHKIIHHKYSKYKTEEERIENKKNLAKEWKKKNKNKINEYHQTYREGHRLSINDRQNKKNYLNKLNKYFTIDEIDEYEKQIKKLIESKNDVVKELCDIIINDNNVRIIINKIVDKNIKSKIRNRLKYIKLKGGGQ